ncbi:MAG: protein kinase [Acidobacteriaceae bacterium]|nr:protein kinase [Acidobacteriaceae bacterium]
MTTEGWLLVKELFENLRSLSPELRRCRLAEIENQDIQREVQELLQSFDQSPEFLERPAVLNAQFTSPSSPACGERLGNYSLVRQVGEGGMGIVYEAHRADGEFEQRVAIKIVKQSFVSTQQIERFRAERRILAKLDHPNICRLIDGGTTAGGLPFLVLEFVDGTRIDAYCQEHSLDVPARLELFREVCEAVEYAHAQGIVHRDLKPANVLVSAGGKPKLLDFGIAKITEPGDSPTATATQFRLATPQYASPEQMRGQPTTPASDIYSLGVILYELLTGRSPSTDSDDEAHRPSKITGIRSWRRSLDRIAMKALREDAEARYVNVRDLISDLNLFLKGREVRPDRRTRHTGYFPLRTGFAALAAVIVILLIAAYGWRTYSKLQDSRPRTLAVLPFRTLTSPSGNEYLSVGLADALITRLSNISQLAVRPTSSILKYAAPTSDLRAAGQNLSVQAILEGSIQETGDRLRVTVQLIRVSDGRPLWAETFNEGASDLFALEDSVSQKVAQKLALRLAVNEREELTRRPTVDATAYRDYLQGRYSAFRFTRQGLDQAIDYFNRAIARDPEYALAYAGLSDAYTTASDWVLPPREALSKAESASRRALSLDDNLAEAHASLGHALMHEWKLSAAGAEFHRALALSPNNTSIYFAYSEYLSATEHEDDAVAQLRRALEIDPQSAEITAFMGWPLYLKPDYQGALEAEDKAIRIDPNLWTARMNRAYILRALHRLPEAIAEFRKALDLNPDSSITLSGLGAAYADSGDTQQAIRTLTALCDMSKRQYVSPMDIGFLEAALGHRDKAIGAFRKGYDDGSEMLLFSKIYGRYYGIGKDSRFQELVRRVNRGW